MPLLPSTLKASPNRRNCSCILALLDKDGCQAVAHDGFGVSENIRLVVNHCIVVGGILLHDFLQVLLLMRVDQHTALNSICQVAMENFLSLKKSVPVTDNYGQP